MLNNREYTETAERCADMNKECWNSRWRCWSSRKMCWELYEICWNNKGCTETAEKCAENFVIKVCFLKKQQSVLKQQINALSNVRIIETVECYKCFVDSRVWMNYV